MRKKIDDEYMITHRRGCSIIVAILTLAFIVLCIIFPIIWPFLITLGLVDLVWILMPYFNKK
jgi:hypothetical protein